MHWISCLTLSRIDFETVHSDHELEYGHGCSLGGVSGYILDGYGHGCSLGGVSGYIHDGYGHGCSLGGVSGYILDGYEHGIIILYTLTLRLDCIRNRLVYIP